MPVNFINELRDEIYNETTGRYEITHFEDLQSIHQPLIVAIDTSNSMNTREHVVGRKNIELANDLLLKIGSDEELDDFRDSIDIHVMSFSNDVRTITQWTPLSHYEASSSRLYAHGCTALHESVCKALNAVHDLKADYARSGISCKRPQVFIITDGFSTDDDNVKEEAKALCRKYVDTRKVSLSFILLPGASTADAKELSSNIKLYKALDCTHGLPAAAEFINASLVAFSSTACGDNAQVELPEGLLTTQSVETTTDGRRFVSEDAEVWL